MITWAELAFFILGLILGAAILTAWHFQDGKPSMSPNRTLLLQRLRNLRRNRLFVITDLPVPKDYTGLKTDDLLDYIDEKKETN